MRAGPVGREDALACEAELACLLAETGHQQQLQERVREASEAFAAASARVKSLHRDWRAAGLEVARLAEELAEAEAAQAAAQVDLEACRPPRSSVDIIESWTWGSPPSKSTFFFNSNQWICSFALAIASQMLIKDALVCIKLQILLFDRL